MEEIAENSFNSDLLSRTEGGSSSRSFALSAVVPTEKRRKRLRPLSIEKFSKEDEVDLVFSFLPNVSVFGSIPDGKKEHLSKEDKVDLELSLFPNVSVFGSIPDGKKEQLNKEYKWDLQRPFFPNASVFGKIDVDFLESVIEKPMGIADKMFEKMSEREVACLKESAREVICNPSWISQLGIIQRALEERSDITLEVLQKSHQTQLRILVAIKTGQSQFLEFDFPMLSSDLAEIYLNLRCRNVKCLIPLVEDECKCHFCAERNGFCRDCMCMVCSKFDMESTTSSWVGCDKCSHWCHVECGLQESCFRNVCSTSKDVAGRELFCVACGHTSEIFGFAFKTCGKDCTAEALSRELNSIRRIFCASNNFRGKRLHEIATQILSLLEDRVNAQEVENRTAGSLNVEMVWHLFAYCCEVLNRTMTLDTEVDLFFKNCDPEGQQVQNMQLKEHEEVTPKISGKKKDEFNWTGFSLSSSSETDMLLERARNLLRGNNRKDPVQGISNNWRSLSSSSSCPIYSPRQTRMNQSRSAGAWKKFSTNSSHFQGGADDVNLDLEF